jgi:hypothetical protein
MPDPTDAPAAVRADGEFPKWIGDSLWVSPDRCALSVYANTACGRHDDDYYKCSSPSAKAVLNCKPDVREFLLRAFRDFPSEVRTDGQ